MRRKGERISTSRNHVFTFAGLKKIPQGLFRRSVDAVASLTCKGAGSVKNRHLKLPSSDNKAPIHT